MCFSANASFIASGVLTILGIIAILQARSTSWRLFAATPLIFAIQQATEGVVWLTINDPSSLGHRMAVYTFLFFALVWWPLWIPCTLRYLETRAIRKTMINFIGSLGGLFSVASLFSLIQHGATASAADHHIAYTTTFWHPYAASMAYVAIVTLPCFISSIKYMWVFGVGLCISLLVTMYLFPLAIGSVWCFFAALLSGCVVYLVRQNKK